jgi:hypothetical protein
MIKTVVIGVSAVGLLLFAAQGYGSGSTRVELASESFLLVLETPRKIFRDSDGEAEYHQDARRRLTRQLEILKPLVEAVIKKLRSAEAEKWKLRKYDALLDAYHDGMNEAEWPKKQQACRYVFPLKPGVSLDGMATMEIAFEALPGAKDRDDLKEWLSKAIREGYRRPEDP